jgi:hypothetical protein
MCAKPLETVGWFPLETSRTCTGMHLREELKSVPDTWLLLAAGRETNGAAAYLLSSRAVVGVREP